MCVGSAVAHLQLQDAEESMHGKHADDATLLQSAKAVVHCRKVVQQVIAQPSSGNVRCYASKCDAA